MKIFCFIVLVFLISCGEKNINELTSHELYEKSFELYEKGDYELALSHIKLLKNYHVYEVPYYELSIQTFYKLGDIDSTNFYLNEALELLPDRSRKIEYFYILLNKCGIYDGRFTIDHIDILNNRLKQYDYDSYIIFGIEFNLTKEEIYKTLVNNKQIDKDQLESLKTIIDDPEVYNQFPCL